MGTGDITVVGLVGESHIIEDIGVIVPRGVAVTVPGHMTLISKDLHRAISQRFLLRVHDAPAPSRAGLPTAERERYEAEIQRLLGQVSALEGRNTLLESQVDGLQKELVGLEAKDAKLDAILSAINERPTVIQNVVAAGSKASPAPAEEKVDGEAPMFIPSTIKSDKVEGERVVVQEETTTTSTVSSAASKLKALRKGKT